MRPFRIDVPPADLDDLRGLATYWRTCYDWRVHEAALNELGQFTTDIGERTVHFVHMPPSGPSFGFSDPPRTAGWTLATVAGMWLELMSELFDTVGVRA